MFFVYSFTFKNICIMKKVVNYFALMLTLILVSSCICKKNKSSSSDTDLLSNKWQVTELSGTAIKNEVNGMVPYLMFDKADKRYSVITGCNAINGEFSSTDNKLTFGLGMSTMMYCEDMSVENGFKSILEKVDSYSINGNELTLKGNNNTVIAKLKKYSVAK